MLRACTVNCRLCRRCVLRAHIYKHGGSKARVEEWANELAGCPWCHDEKGPREIVGGLNNCYISRPGVRHFHAHTSSARWGYRIGRVDDSGSYPILLETKKKMYKKILMPQSSCCSVRLIYYGNTLTVCVDFKFHISPLYLLECVFACLWYVSISLM